MAYNFHTHCSRLTSTAVRLMSKLDVKLRPQLQQGRCNRTECLEAKQSSPDVFGSYSNLNLNLNFNFIKDTFQGRGRKLT